LPAASSSAALAISCVRRLSATPSATALISERVTATVMVRPMAVAKARLKRFSLAPISPTISLPPSGSELARTSASTSGASAPVRIRTLWGRTCGMISGT
jgi:hypothetical protein